MSALSDALGHLSVSRRRIKRAIPLLEDNEEVWDSIQAALDTAYSMLTHALQVLARETDGEEDDE